MPDATPDCAAGCVERPTFTLQARSGQILLGLAVSLFFLYLATGNLEWRRFVHALTRLSAGCLFVGALVSGSAFVLRGWRWRSFFPRDVAPTWWQCMRSLLIGYAANNVLPARAGEVIRTHYLGSLSGLSRSRILATVFLERAFDVFTLILLFVVAAAALRQRMLEMQGFRPLAILAMAVLLTLCAVALFIRLRAPTRVPAVSSRLRRMTCQFVEGLTCLGSSSAVCRIFGLSLLIWTLDTVACWSILSSFRDVRVPWDAALAVNVFGNFGTMLPAAPSAVGTMEFCIVKALEPWQVQPSLAFAMAVVVHIQQALLVTVPGALCWVSLGIVRPTSTPRFAD